MSKDKPDRKENSIKNPVNPLGMEAWAPLSLDQFEQHAKKLLGKLDTNKDDLLDDTELSSAVQDPKHKGRDAEVVATIYNNREALKPLNNDQWWWVGETKVSVNDLREGVKRAKVPDDTLSSISKNLGDESAWSGNLSLGLYKVTLHPLNSINFLGINQGKIGDCYFLAPVASMAAKTPERIYQMIKDNGNDTFTVTFPGDPTNPITIATPTESERGFCNRSDQGLWPNVLEKAFGEYRRQHGHRGNTPSEGADGGGSAEDVLRLLTGKTAFTEDLAHPAAVKIRLTFADREHRAVTCCSSQKHPDDKFTTDGYSKNHAYSVVVWDKDGPDGGTLILHNPNGSQLQLSFNKFTNNFTQITFEGR